MFLSIFICFLKIVHRSFLFQENQVPVDNLMLLLLRPKMYARTLWDLFCMILYGTDTGINLNGHLICSAQSCCTWLYFDWMVFVDLIEKVLAKT